METNRLLIRPMKDSDQSAFLDGIADRTLQIAYGFPKDMDETIPPKIFRRFRELTRAYSIIEKATGDMVAFAVFPPYQQQGYMKETLNAYIPQLFRNHAVTYIHCGHFADNEPSRRLLQKIGFREYANHTFKDRIIIDQIKQR